MNLFKRIKRRKFYEGVKFANKNSKKYLRDSIFYYANEHDFKYFRYITNYISHAAREVVFKISYPITISGYSLHNIQIKDSENKTYHIKLLQDKIVYYEKYKNIINFYVAKFPYESEKSFYKETYEYLKKE